MCNRVLRWIPIRHSKAFRQERCLPFPSVDQLNRRHRVLNSVPCSSLAIFSYEPKSISFHASLSLTHSHSAREIFAENKMYVRGGYLIIAHHASMIIKRRIIRKKRMARIRGNYYPRNYYCFVPWLPSLTIVRQSRPLAITTY